MNSGRYTKSNPLNPMKSIQSRQILERNLKSLVCCLLGWGLLLIFSPFHSVFFSLPWCILLEHFLELHFELSVVLLSGSLFLAFLVVTPDVIYTYTTYHSLLVTLFQFELSIEILPPFTSLYSLLYNIIILNITLTYIENHITQYYNFCFNYQAQFRKRKRKCVVLTLYFNSSHCSSFLPDSQRFPLLLSPSCLENVL